MCCSPGVTRTRPPHPERLLAQQAYLAGGSGVNWGELGGHGQPDRHVAGQSDAAAMGAGLCRHPGTDRRGVSLASARCAAFQAGVAGAAAVAAFALPFKLNILLAIAAAVALCLMLEATPHRRPPLAMNAETDLWTVLVIVGLTLDHRFDAHIVFHVQQTVAPAALGAAWPAIRADRGTVGGDRARNGHVARPASFSTWQDARLFAALAGAMFFLWRRGQGQAVLGTIVVGMLVYLPLHLLLGW
jgi:hypothetical protein